MGNIYKIKPGEVGIRFGAMSPPIKDQLGEQGWWLPDDVSEAIQKDADAITRLAVRGLLGSNAKMRAHEKLVKNVCDLIAEHRPIPAGD
jgi:hypothetical protein